MSLNPTNDFIFSALISLTFLLEAKGKWKLAVSLMKPINTLDNMQEVNAYIGSFYTLLNEFIKIEKMDRALTSTAYLGFLMNDEEFMKKLSDKLLV